MGIPLQQVAFREEDFKNNLSLFNLQWQNLVQAINQLQGNAGTIKLASHIDLGGNRIINVGDAVAGSDVVTKTVAEANYGASAIQPQIEALGKDVLQTTRRLNDKSQRENYSSFLNNLVSTAPTTNTAQVIFGTASGGFVPVTISSGLHQKVDSSVVPFAAFNDSLAQPTTFALATLNRTSNEVTGVTSAANTLVVGETIYVAGAGDFSFTGYFPIDTIVNPTTFKYPQNAPNASTTGGSAALGGVYYYFLKKGSNTLGRSGPFSADTWSNRLSANVDGQAVIAVVTVNGTSGGDATQSAGGATPPSVTNNIRLFGRL